MPNTFYWMSEDGKIRKITKSEGGYWDVFAYRQMYNQWQYHDNVGEDTALEYFNDADAKVLVEAQRGEI